VETGFPSENATSAKMLERFLVPVSVKPLLGAALRAREDTQMRLPLLPPSSLSGEQKELYDIMGVMNESFGSFVATREDGVLIGPFNPMLHFPVFGRAQAQ
jgi:hypothetical protein